MFNRTVFHVQHTFEREPWDVDVGAALHLARWGVGFTADYLGSSSPNGIVLYLGPLALWVTVWHWPQKSPPLGTWMTTWVSTNPSVGGGSQESQP